MVLCVCNNIYGSEYALISMALCLYFNDYGSMNKLPSLWLYEYTTFSMVHLIHYILYVVMATLQSLWLYAYTSQHSLWFYPNKTGPKVLPKWSPKYSRISSTVIFLRISFEYKSLYYKTFYSIFCPDVIS
jgi:hypothetical protein